MSGVEIIGLGHYVPERRVGNDEIGARLGLKSGWIVRRTGIEERRYVSDDQALSDIAIIAGEAALAHAGMARSDVALLLLATSTPDHLLPPTAPLVAHRLGLSSVGGIDMAGACAGFIYALTLGDSYVRTHNAPVLIIAANILSRRINPADRASSVLFADAAGAIVLAPSSRATAGVRAAKLAAQGGSYGLIHIPGGGSRKPFSRVTDPIETLMVISNGQAVYAEAVAMMTASARTVLDQAKVTTQQIDHFIPHQANGRMMAAVAHQLDIADGKVCSTIGEYGNSSAATIPLTLSMCAPQRAYQSGDKILMTAAGAGLTGGAIVFEY